MDPNRFDLIAKSLGQSRSRRGLMKAVGAAALGALGLSRPTSAAGCRLLGQTCSPTSPCCSSTVCTNGVCKLPGAGGCLPAFTNCNGHCTLLTTDVNNCGACGHVCPADMPICGGHCMCSSTSCPAGQGCCGAGGSCIDVTSDVHNCGSCGTVCPTPANGAAVCSNSTCGVTCNAGYADCNGDPSDGCEVQTAGDVNNCGACGNVCPGPTSGSGTATCSSGTCGISCTSGELCGTACVDTGSDPSNCGNCGNVCPTGEMCTNGSCVGTCTPPGGPCDLSNPDTCCNLVCEQVDDQPATCR